jgi:hypothetical protein
VVEVANPHETEFPHPTTTSNMIYKIFDILHMQWMGIWICHHAITIILGDGQDFKIQLLIGANG